MRPITPAFIPPPVPLIPTATNVIVPTGGALAGALAGGKAGAVLGPKGALLGALLGAIGGILAFPSPTAPGTIPGLDPGLNDPEPTPDPEPQPTPPGVYPVPDPPGTEGLTKVYRLWYRKVQYVGNYRNCSSGSIITPGDYWTELDEIYFGVSATSLTLKFQEGRLSYSCGPGLNINEKIRTLSATADAGLESEKELLIAQDNFIELYNAATYYEKPNRYTVRLERITINDIQQALPVPVPKPSTNPRPTPIPINPLPAPDPKPALIPVPAPGPQPEPVPVPNPGDPTAPPVTLPKAPPAVPQTPASPQPLKPAVIPIPSPIPGIPPLPDGITRFFKVRLLPPAPLPIPGSAPAPAPVPRPSAKTTPGGEIVPVKPPPITTTPKDTHFPITGQPGVTPGGTRGDIESVAKEVGRIEQKAGSLLGKLGALAEILNGLSGLLPDAPVLADTYLLAGVCEDLNDDGKQPVFSRPVKGGDFQTAAISRLDAMQDLLQAHLGYKTPTCNDRPQLEGDWRTISFISDEVSPEGRNRLRKRFRYRSSSGVGLEGVINHWKDFSFTAGAVCVQHKGASWGTPQVWASSIDEGKRVIRHAAGEAGVDPDQVGQWRVSGSNNPRYGMPGTMRVNTKGGYYWITARDGEDGRPDVGRL